MINYFLQRIIQPSIDLFRSPIIFFREQLKDNNIIDPIIFVITMGLMSSFIQIVFYFIDQKLIVGVGLIHLVFLLYTTLIVLFKIVLHENLAILISAFIYPILFLLICLIWTVIIHLVWKMMRAKKKLSNSLSAISYCTVIFPISSLLLIAANVYNFMADVFYNFFFILSILTFLYFQNIVAIEIQSISAKKVWISSIIIWPTIISMALIFTYNNL
jgi:hypothetical protein